MATAFGLSSSNVFEGNDGPWSTFRIALGTPQQSVNVLPATSLDYIIVTDSSFCSGATGSSLATCAALRGGLFNSNGSKTFLPVANDKGYYEEYALPFPSGDTLYPLQCSADCDNTGTGYFPNTSSLLGTDIISLAYSNGKNMLLPQQLVAAFAGAEPDLGFLGLALPTLNVSDTQTYPSPLQALADLGLTTSRYFAYNAGSYRQNFDGSLTIGGYDKNRGDVSGAPYWDLTGGSNELSVDISSIVVQANPGFNYTDTIYASIDTTVPELWLPTGACKSFEIAFGLTWNESLYMYLLSADQHQSLLNLNPSVTFTLGGSNLQGSDGGQEFTLSYASFDLEARWPLAGIQNNLSQIEYFFPLKRASDGTQCTLGRMFFQETQVSSVQSVNISNSADSRG